MELSHDAADVRALYLGATALAGLGAKARAAEWIDRARAMAPDDPVVLEYAAVVHARSGRNAAAVGCLEQAIALGYRDRRWIAAEPDFAPLHADACFRAILRAPRCRKARA